MLITGRESQLRGTLFSLSLTLNFMTTRNSYTQLWHSSGFISIAQVFSAVTHKVLSALSCKCFISVSQVFPALSHKCSQLSHEKCFQLTALSYKCSQLCHKSALSSVAQILSVLSQNYFISVTQLLQLCHTALLSVTQQRNFSGLILWCDVWFTVVQDNVVDGKGCALAGHCS